MGEFTRILDEARSGDLRSSEELLTLVYKELRQLAAHRMASEAPGHTLQPTALVHEAWLRLVGTDAPPFQSRGHFFSAAAEAMRRILIEHARREQAIRHGGAWKRVDLDDADLPAPAGDGLSLAVSEALDKLAVEHRVEAELVKLRYFVGLTIDEASEVLGISPRTAKYYWTHARAWLFREVTGMTS